MRNPDLRKCFKVYEYIEKYKKAHDGNSPTIREIGAACGMHSTSHVKKMLEKLASLGYIRLPEEGKRAAARIEVIGGYWIAPGEPGPTIVNSGGSTLVIPPYIVTR